MTTFTLTVERTVKINLGNYENTDIKCSLTQTFELTGEPGEHRAAYTILASRVREMIRDEITAIKAAKSDTTNAKEYRRYGVD